MWALLTKPTPAAFEEAVKILRPLNSHDDRPTAAPSLKRRIVALKAELKALDVFLSTTRSSAEGWSCSISPTNGSPPSAPTCAIARAVRTG